MLAALSLARRGLGNVWPNPAVGCVLVSPDLGHRVAMAADQEGGAVIGVGMAAGDKGVEPLDLVREPVFHKEIEGAIGHRGL